MSRQSERRRQNGIQPTLDVSRMSRDVFNFNWKLWIIGNEFLTLTGMELSVGLSAGDEISILYPNMQFRTVEPLLFLFSAETHLLELTCSAHSVADIIYLGGNKIGISIFSITFWKIMWMFHSWRVLITWGWLIIFSLHFFFFLVEVIVSYS